MDIQVLSSVPHCKDPFDGRVIGSRSRIVSLPVDSEINLMQRCGEYWCPAGRVAGIDATDDAFVALLGMPSALVKPGE